MASSATETLPATRNSLLIERMIRFSKSCIPGTVCPLPTSNTDEDVLAALRPWGMRHRPYPHEEADLHGYSAYVKFCTKCHGKHFMSPQGTGLWDARTFICRPCTLNLTDEETFSYDQGVYVGKAEKDGKVVLEWKARCKLCKCEFFLTHADKRRSVAKGAEVKRRKMSESSIARAPESYEPPKVLGGLPLIYFCDRCDTDKNKAVVKKLTKQHARDAKVVSGGVKAYRKKMDESADRKVALHSGEDLPVSKTRKANRKPREQSSLDITPAMFRRGR